MKSGIYLFKLELHIREMRNIVAKKYPKITVIEPTLESYNLLWDNSVGERSV